MIGEPAALLQAADGMDLRIVASFSSINLSGHLVARPGIEDADGLRGKRVGVRVVGAGLWISTMLALEQLGLDSGRDCINEDGGHAMSMYHEGQRHLQDRYRGRAVADRLEQHRMHRTFTDSDREFIETSRFFFLATACGDSVDCSMKGGIPGFVRVTAPDEVAWPDYDGNRMYRSLGNIIKSPAVGVLFVKFDAKSTRLRISGKARIDESPDAIADLPGAKRLIRVAAEYIFYNCPRYIPRMEFVEDSVYSPRRDHIPPEPEWKTRDYIRDVLNEP